MRSSHWRGRSVGTVTRLSQRLAPAILLLALVVLVSACDSTATVTVSGGQPTATATTGSGLPTATTGLGGAVFTQVASSPVGDSTVISGNSATDGHPNAVLECSPRWDTSTKVYDDHNIGVYYTGGHWAIFNQDLSAMPTNATFNCAVYGG
jgi:hypothetical protein